MGGPSPVAAALLRRRRQSASGGLPDISGGFDSFAEAPRIFQAVGASFYLTGPELRQQAWIRTSSQRKTRNMATQFGQVKVASVCTGIICAALVFAPLSSADPNLGHFVNVQAASLRMRCEVGPDTASGQSSWRTANLGIAPPAQPDIVLVDGKTYHFQGWTIAPTGDGTTFTNDVTRHGMTIDGGYNVKSR